MNMRGDSGTTSVFDIDSLLEGVTDDTRRAIRTVWVTGSAPVPKTTVADEKSLSTIRRRMADIAEAGVGHDCHAEVYLDKFDYRLPRGIPWTAYPVSLAPRLRRKWMMQYGDDVAHVVDPYPELRIERCHSVPTLTALAEASDMVVDMSLDASGPVDGRLDAMMVLVWACLVCRDLAPNVRRVGFRHGDGAFAWHSPDEAAALVRGMLGWMRFRYSYMVNANAILGKALAHAIYDNDPAEVIRDCAALGLKAGPIDVGPGHVSRGLVWDRRYDAWRGELHELCHPLTLQVLFRLARKGGVSTNAFAETTQVREFLPGLFEDGETSDGDGLRPAWAGSGKHETLTWVGSGKHEPQRYPYWHGFRVAKSLAVLGLVRVGEDSRLSLAPAGRRLLDAIHPDMEDADLLCRWNRPILANEDIDARADAWIGKAFKKCKTRVNGLRTERPDFDEFSPKPSPWEMEIGPGH